MATSGNFSDTLVCRIAAFTTKVRYVSCFRLDHKRPQATQASVQRAIHTEIQPCELIKTFIALHTSSAITLSSVPVASSRLKSP